MIYIDDKELKEFYHLSDDDIKNKTLSEIQKMINNMKSQKALKEQMQNFKDKEFTRLIRKFFTPYEFLKQWWSDEEIIFACSKHLSTENIVQEYQSKTKQCPYSNADFIREGHAYFPIYIQGHELAEKAYEKCFIFRIKNNYQHLYQGKVIKELLYTKYPQLEKYNFEFYGITDFEKYEIYPKNHIYTPFNALMNKDIDAIKNRNMSYAISYNGGIYTPDATKERLSSDEATEYFDVIANL